jgi:hypothetical protein
VQQSLFGLCPRPTALIHHQAQVPDLASILADAFWFLGTHLQISSFSLRRERDHVAGIEVSVDAVGESARLVAVIKESLVRFTFI